MPILYDPFSRSAHFVTPPLLQMVQLPLLRFRRIVDRLNPTVRQIEDRSLLVIGGSHISLRDINHIDIHKAEKTMLVGGERGGSVSERT